MDSTERPRALPAGGSVARASSSCEPLSCRSHMNTALIALRVAALLGPWLVALVLRLSPWRRRVAPTPSPPPTAPEQERWGSTVPRATFFAGGLAFCLALGLPLLAPGLGTVNLG